MDTKIILLQPEQITPLWDLAEPWLTKALRRCGRDVRELYPRLLTRHMQLWLIMEDTDCVGAFCTQVEIRDDKKVLWIEALAGKGMKRWAKLVDDALHIMQEHAKCDEIGFQTTRKAQGTLAKFNYRSGDNERWVNTND